ncbi:MAG: Gfo/Idh/MocA family oxidoreductase [Candidatus Brocadiae bacterium]|nr:Gfo/Idh/MocA family oxidoreductase [Candidatus Brocadiia bacterium]
MSGDLKRRDFLSAGALGAGLLVLRSGMLKAAPSDKLNLAGIGIGGRGWGDINGCASENVVALCDVNKKNLARAAKKWPQAKTYEDWRKCLEQKDIDAVVCATTDHTHAFVNVWAMNRGKHVYCEKPLANSVEEANLVRQTYLKNKGKLATQMGTQIHATANYRRMVEMVRGGAIGTPQSVRVWCSRMPKGGSYLPKAGDPPDWLNWDLWIGPAPMHDYNPGYVGGCLKWNRFWDFGSGQIGDMGSHMMDMAYWALDLALPTTCKAEGSPISTDTVPTWLTAEWEHPKNDWRPAVKVSWHDGGKKPGLPSKVFYRDGMFKGTLFKGDKGYLIADYGYRILMPTSGDMTHYKAPKSAADLIPPSPGHHQEWLIGCKTGKPPLCNFDYAGAMIENNLLALVAYRVGKKLEWDSANLKAKGCPEADKFIRKQYRKGWVLNG